MIRPLDFGGYRTPSTQELDVAAGQALIGIDFVYGNAIVTGSAVDEEGNAVRVSRIQYSSVDLVCRDGTGLRVWAYRI